MKKEAEANFAKMIEKIHENTDYKIIKVFNCNNTILTVQKSEKN